jgi:hypothetical protein
VVSRVLHTSDLNTSSPPEERRIGKAEKLFDCYGIRKNSVFRLSRGLPVYAARKVGYFVGSHGYFLMVAEDLGRTEAEKKFRKEIPHLERLGQMS